MKTRSRTIVFQGWICSLVFSAFVFAFGSEAPQGVHCDIDPLREVIILPPGDEQLRETYGLYEDVPWVSLAYAEGMAQQYARFLDLLNQEGIRTLNIMDLLESALSNARTAGRLSGALAEIFPEHYPRWKDKANSITPPDILGHSAQFFYSYDEKGNFHPLIPASPFFFYTRDFAVSAPSGIILTNSRQKSRTYEHRIGRFIFRYASELKNHPLLFDAEFEGVRCEGGDIIIKDERTILMGIDNLSDREAAEKIARKLNMDVVGVAMPTVEDFGGANVEILHLDTVFNLVDEDKALTVPYFFLKKYAQDNPVVRLLKAIHNRPRPKPGKGELDFPFSLKKSLGQIPKVGWLTLFRAGSGEAVSLDKKLGDYLEEQGYKIIPVGGEQGKLREDEYLLERVLYELSLQAANVVQLSPGKVIAYAHNKYTNQALQNNGIEVLSFEAKYLADGLGGPHCLTMPLVREK